MIDGLPELLRVDEVAEYMKVGRSTIYEAIRRGEFPSVRLGRRILIPRHRLMSFLDGATPDAHASQAMHPKLAERMAGVGR